MGHNAHLGSLSVRGVARLRMVAAIKPAAAVVRVLRATPGLLCHDCSSSLAHRLGLSSPNRDARLRPRVVVLVAHRCWHRRRERPILAREHRASGKRTVDYRPARVVICYARP